MAKQLTISIPHRLTEQEVKSRLATAIADARKKHPKILAGARESWSGNRMDFHAAAMGQTISGDVLIEKETVQLRINLPWALAMFAQRIRPQVETEARRLLEE